MSTTLVKAGRYELREELGRGAMGVVYRGHDPVIGRDVAVKTLHLSETGTGMSHEELVSRFQTEARAAGVLAHPNIVVVYDAGEESGVFYITMEMVEGRSLQALLDARQSFPLSRVLRVMEQVCSALDFAHQRGIVHRDVKPANLMLTDNDTLKITDFGTAKILQFGTAQTTHVMGTPSYMSPEQVKGKPVDGRSDIFSLGVILYELATGEKPFPGQNISTVIYKIINEEPIPPRMLDSSIPAALSAVITRALSKDPSQRFQSCNEMLESLRNYHETADPEPPAKPAAQAARQNQPARAVEPSQRTSESNQTGATDYFAEQLAIEQHEAAKRRGNIVLTVILLAVIAFAGYRVWPAAKDLWQRLLSPTGEVPAAAGAQASLGKRKTLPAISPQCNDLKPPASPLIV